MKRRIFLQNTSITLDGLSVIPMNLRCTARSPNNLINIGKHVCCEKPTLTIDEGRLLCDVINLDYDLWLGPAPEIPFINHRTFYHFRWYNAFSGGLLTDWGAHYCDTAQLVTGNDTSGPIEIVTAGESLFYDNGVFNTAYQFGLQYKYAMLL